MSCPYPLFRHLSPCDSKSHKLLQTVLQGRVSDMMLTSLLLRSSPPIPTFLTHPHSCDSSVHHPLWRLWQEGCGWCDSFQTPPLADGRRYWIFEPGWLRMIPTNSASHAHKDIDEGILVTRDLLEICFQFTTARVMRPTHADDESNSSTAVNNTAASANDLDLSVDVQFENIRAVQTVSSQLDSSERMLSSEYLPAADFPKLPPLHSWSLIELRALLHAWESLSRASFLLRTAGAFRMHLRGSSEWLPVLLPWPREYGPGDTRPSPVQYPRRCHRMIMWQVLEWEGKWNSNTSPSGGDTLNGRRNQDGHLPVYDPDEDLESVASESASVSHLSSVVRGCPWPLDVVNDEGDDGLIRRHQECNIVARRVALTLRLSRQLVDGGVNTAFWHQPGPRTASIRSSTWEEQSVGIKEMFDLRATNTTSQAHAGCLSYLQCLLTSSLVVSMGSDHTYPWPVILLVPLAPGWIGGFMSSANTMG